jgi:hypothetical protein
MRQYAWGWLALVLGTFTTGSFENTVTWAQDSGPGPESGTASRSYQVTILKVGTMDQGTFSFTASDPPATENPTDSDEQDGLTDDQATPPTDPGTNPVASGDFGTVGNPNGVPGNVTGNTSGAVAGNMSGAMNGTGTTSTNTTTATTGSGQPASYWTRARANGQVARESNDPNSADYWTTARANGEGGASPTTPGGGGSDEPTSALTSGELLVETGETSGSGTWYAYDAGDYSWWVASVETTDGNVLLAGYATQESVAGRIFQSEGGSFFDSLLTGGFFYGEASADEAPDEDLAEVAGN